MARLRGTGVGMGVGLGTAAVVRVHRGIALAPEPTEAIARQIALGRQAEKPDVVIVASDYGKALAVADGLEWGHVVGIAAEAGMADAPVTEFPAVLGIDGLMEAANDNALMLVDAERGIVIADPDGLDIAAYQAERTNLSPRKVLYLDEAHQPAKTLDGRSVQVVAIVKNTAEVDRALENGADALYIPFSTLLLAIGTSQTEIRRRLLKLIERAPGKPIFLAGEYALPLVTYLEAATRADITLDTIPDGQEIAVAFEECFQNDLACAMPRFARFVSNLGRAGKKYYREWIEKQVADGMTRLVFAFEWADSSDANARSELKELLPEIEELFVVAAENLIPTYCRLFDYTAEDFTQEIGLQMLVGAGVTGILTPNAAQVKTTIRGLSFAECQEAYLQTMRAAEAEV